MAVSSDETNKAASQNAELKPANTPNLPTWDQKHRLEVYRDPLGGHWGADGAFQKWFKNQHDIDIGVVVVTLLLHFPVVV